MKTLFGVCLWICLRNLGNALTNSERFGSTDCGGEAGLGKGKELNFKIIDSYSIRLLTSSMYTIISALVSLTQVICIVFVYRSYRIVYKALYPILKEEDTHELTYHDAGNFVIIQFCYLIIKHLPL